MDFDILFSILTCVFGVLWVVDYFGMIPKFWKGKKPPEPTGVPTGQGLGIVHDLNKTQRRSWAKYYAIGFVISLGILCGSVLFGHWFTQGYAYGESMIPTLPNGEKFLINNWSYDIPLPFTEKRLKTGNPQIGEVVSFRYPLEPDKYVLKRVAAVPGDTVSYYNKILFINGKPAPQEYQGVYIDPETPAIQDKFKETLGKVEHQIVLRRGAPLNAYPLQTHNALGFCNYNQDGMKCVIPQNQYFVIGDNRDVSGDSRHWGFVPRSLLEGRAFLKWPDGHPLRVRSINADN